MSLKEVNQDSFENEVIKSDIPVLIDLWAPWCGPCRALHPIVEKVAEDFSGKLKVMKLNIDESPSIAGKYQVMSIPTLLLFSKGEVEIQIIGLVSKDKIVKKITPFIN